MQSSTISAKSTGNDPAPPAWTLSIALKLGRTSNLPTVWTNVLAALVLSGGQASWPTLLVLLVAMSCAYIGGMYLNDAFDCQYDAAERPERPIPSGHISAMQVFVAGYSLLALAIVLTHTVALNVTGTLSCTLLCVGIVLYNVWHKGNPISPLLMGFCRALVYVTCALANTATLTPAVLAGALILLGYLIGLTYSAKHEGTYKISNLWPLLLLASPLIATVISATFNAISILAVLVFIAWCLHALYRIFIGRIGMAVSQLIAGICLTDGLLICLYSANLSEMTSAVVNTLWLSCVSGSILTIVLQRHIAGT